MSAVSTAEIDAYHGPLKRQDGGRAFPRIMQRFETTAEKQALYRSTIGAAPHGVQVIWSKLDPALRVETFGAAARVIPPRSAGVAGYL